MTQPLSPAERTFRARLVDVLADLACPLPSALAAALDEHLYRHDAQGYSLCFAGPERERLLAELNPLLFAYNGDTL